MASRPAPAADFEPAGELKIGQVGIANLRVRTLDVARLAEEMRSRVARAPKLFDRAGRVTVEPDLTLPGHPEVIALGDMVRVKSTDGGVQDLPGVAPVAMQQGRYAAASVKRRLRGRRVKPFRYIDKGNLATIGRARAVAEIKGLHFGGPVAWLLWLGIHIFYLIGFQNRFLVLTRWLFSFLTRGRGARLITGETPPGVGGTEPQV